MKISRAEKQKLAKGNCEFLAGYVLGYAMHKAYEDRSGGIHYGMGEPCNPMAENAYFQSLPIKRRLKYIRDSVDEISDTL